MEEKPRYPFLVIEALIMCSQSSAADCAHQPFCGVAAIPLHINGRST